MRNLIGLFLILAFGGPAFSEEAKEIITFKGISLGQPGSRQVLHELCKENKSNLDRDPKMIELLGKPCSVEKNWIAFRVDYGNLSDIHAIFKLNENGAINQVEIEDFRNNILALVEVLESKYGKSIKSNEAVENKLGTKFDKSIFIWSDVKGNKIMVESMYKTIQKGRIVLQSAETVEVDNRLEKMIKEVGKANL